jgi:hypothetical protein
MKYVSCLIMALSGWIASAAFFTPLVPLPTTRIVGSSPQYPTASDKYSVTYLTYEDLKIEYASKDLGTYANS